MRTGPTTEQHLKIITLLKVCEGRKEAGHQRPGGMSQAWLARACRRSGMGRTQLQREEVAKPLRLSFPICNVGAVIPNAQTVATIH